MTKKQKNLKLNGKPIVDLSRLTHPELVELIANDEDVCNQLIDEAKELSKNDCWDDERILYGFKLGDILKWD